MIGRINFVFSCRGAMWLRGVRAVAAFQSTRRWSHSDQQHAPRLQWGVLLIGFASGASLALVAVSAVIQATIPSPESLYCVHCGRDWGSHGVDCEAEVVGK